MRFFPVFLDVEGRRVVAVGGGEQVAQKVRLLLRTQADIVVVAEEVTAELAVLAASGRIDRRARPFEEADLDGARLVFAASGDAAVDGSVAALARSRGVPVNVIDDPALCSFYTPAIVDRDPVVVAIGTEGTAPVLARRLKAAIEAMLPPALGELARVAAGLRRRVAADLPAGAPRRRFWDLFFSGPIRDRFLAGDRPGYRSAVEQALVSCSAGAQAPGPASVSLVGAGPGDPDLLTLKAQRKLQEADVIVHDRLVGPGILEYARRDALRIAVGKTPGKPSTGQDEINAILVEHALAGRTVVRLKGGDPYVFGRGAEEQAALEARGIAVDVVPGITAASACAASIGLPLTTRGRNRGVVLLTGTASDGPAEHDWEALARPGTAFAIYMGVANAGHIQHRLLNAGIDPATPVVIVENGTLPTERCVSTSIAHLKTGIRRAGITGPAMIYVGLRWPRQQRAVATAAAGTLVPFPGQRAPVLAGRRRESAL